MVCLQAFCRGGESEIRLVIVAPALRPDSHGTDGNARWELYFTANEKVTRRTQAKLWCTRYLQSLNSGCAVCR